MVDRKDSVRVDKLKEALIAPTITVDDDEDTSSSQSNTSLPILHPTPIKKLNEINAFLKELNMPEHNTSTVSLVNPPY